MEIQTFDPRLSAASAVDRTDRLTLGSYLRAKVATLIGIEHTPNAVSPVYYPDYIAYTTVELHHVTRSTRTVKFLVGIDAVTGRVGEVDIELPPREEQSVKKISVIPPRLDQDEAGAKWREWILPYLDRTYRPIKRPEYTLDRVELIYVPYWLIDYGTLDESFVISGLTRQVEKVEDLQPVKEYYERTFTETTYEQER
ncbi:hypothetical protein [Halegenticoccus tardaugens]|uniref:hypothetical protein n=1 Tax=Halegenticoccus tardaugens TaxID=2071624 RepID=UPI00100AF8C3|nr:hypothetical protein [Halegenticoccus tardaugens]